MRRRMFLTLTLALGLATAAHADYVSTFEDLGLPADSFDNNAGPSGQFVSGGNSFNNSYDATYGVWSGWAVSSKTDTTTPDYTNQYSAVTGVGGNGSPTYAVAFTFGDNTDPFHPASSVVDLAAGTSPASIQVTNTTYAYYAMLNGSQFSHAFGPGSFFELTVAGYAGPDATGAKVGEVDFYLANFLNGNSSIVNTWQTIDLTPLAGARSLQFGLISSDNDPVYGQNTPSYFAADNLVSVSAVPEPSGLVLSAVGVLVLGGGLGRRPGAWPFAGRTAG